MHITIRHFPHFYVMDVISKESIRQSAAQLATKRLWVKPLDETPADPTALSFRPSSSSAPSSSSGAAVSLVDIMEQL